MQGLPSGRCRKGGRPKRKRVRESLPEILTTITLSLNLKLTALVLMLPVVHQVM